MYCSTVLLRICELFIWTFLRINQTIHKLLFRAKHCKIICLEGIFNKGIMERIISANTKYITCPWNCEIQYFVSLGHHYKTSFHHPLFYNNKTCCWVLWFFFSVVFNVIFTMTVLFYDATSSHKAYVSWSHWTEQEPFMRPSMTLTLNDKNKVCEKAKCSYELRCVHVIYSVSSTLGHHSNLLAWQQEIL